MHQSFLLSRPKNSWKNKLMKQAILAQAILLKHCIARACGEFIPCVTFAQRVAFFPFCSPIRRCGMPRRGWSHFETPSGWHTVVRGRRPPSEVWPKQQWSWRWQRSQWPKVAAARHQTTKPKIPRRWDRGGSQSRPPAPSEVHAAAVDRVHRLEAAIEALGVGSEEAKGLEEALVRAKRGANLAPVGERLDSTAQFVERCKKRLQSAEAAVKEAIVLRDKAVAELEAGQRNLETQSGGCSTGAGTPNSTGESSSNHRARAHGRGIPVEISSCRIEVRTGGVSQETHTIVVSALSRHPSSAKSVPHGVGCVPRPAGWTAQRFQDGSFDQSGKYHGVEFQPVQPFLS